MFQGTKRFRIGDNSDKTISYETIFALNARHAELVRASFGKKDISPNARGISFARVQPQPSLRISSQARGI